MQERKQELEAYFEMVNSANDLPHSPNAVALWQEYADYGNYAHAGGYYDQTAQWRDDMTYINAEVEYARLNDDIEKAEEALSELRQPLRRG